MKWLEWKNPKNDVYISDFFKAWWPHWKRFLTPWNDWGDFFGLHSWSNLWVEPAKKSLEGDGYGYHYGHVLSILIALLGIVILLLSIF